MHTIRVELGARWATKDVNGVNGQHIVIALDVGEGVVPLPPPHHEDHPTEPPKTEERAVAFPPPTGAIILGGVGLVGLGLGIGSGLDASSKKSDGQTLEQSHPCASPTSAACGQINDLHDQSTRSALISNIEFIGGGALLAGGIVWWLVAPRRVQESARIVPVLNKGFAGLSVGQEF